MHSIYINNLGVKIKLLEENAEEHLCNSRKEKLFFFHGKNKKYEEKGRP